MSTTRLGKIVGSYRPPLSAWTYWQENGEWYVIAPSGAKMSTHARHGHPLLRRGGQLMTWDVGRYAVVRNPDGRAVVVDKQDENRWVDGPTTFVAARAAVARRNRAWRAALADEAVRAAEYRGTTEEDARKEAARQNAERSS